jgi:hypothetical protein
LSSASVVTGGSGVANANGSAELADGAGTAAAEADGSAVGASAELGGSAELVLAGSAAAALGDADACSEAAGALVEAGAVLARCSVLFVRDGSGPDGAVPLPRTSATTTPKAAPARIATPPERISRDSPSP